jgi:hypothetical protein
MTAAGAADRGTGRRGRRGLLALCTLAGLITGGQELQGQMLRSVKVNIINQNFEPAEIRVVDEACEVIAFEGRLSPNSSITVSLCPDRQRRGRMTIYHSTGQVRRYSRLMESNIYLPTR